MNVQCHGLLFCDTLGVMIFNEFLFDVVGYSFHQTGVHFIFMLMTNLFYVV